MSKTLDAMLAARTRIAQGWCQGTEAITQAGTPCEADDPKAVAFCIFGAVLAQLHPDAPTSEATKVLDLFAQFVPSDRDALLGLGADVVGFNDDPATTQADMLALVDKAIAHQLAIGEA